MLVFDPPIGLDINTSTESVVSDVSVTIVSATEALVTSDAYVITPEISVKVVSIESSAKL